MSDATTIMSAASNTITAITGQVGTALSTLSNKLSQTTATSWTATTPSNLSALTSLGRGMVATPADGTLDSAVKAAFATITTALGSVTLGTLPTAPTIADTYKSPVWSDTYWTNLKDLLTDFTSGITGPDDVSSVVTKLTSETDQLQVALYAADKERKQQVLRDSYSAADSTTGSRGFSYPNSMTLALKMAAMQHYTFEMSQASRDLVKLIFEWAKSNYQFTVDKQITAHNADVEFNLRYAETLIKVYETQARTILDKYRAEVAGSMEKLKATVEGYQSRLAVLKTNTDIDAEIYRLGIADWSARAQENMSQAQVGLQNSNTLYQAQLTAALETVKSITAMAGSAGNIAIAVAQGT